MPEQIYIGNNTKGQVTNRNAFNLDNDAFPFLFNFYAWRGRVKRKRGTILLDQMRIQKLISGATAVITGATQANPCVITAANTFKPGESVKITGVAGMVQLNNNTYIVTAATAANFTININSTTFGAYVAGGTATLVNNWPLVPFNLVNGFGNFLVQYGLTSWLNTPQIASITAATNTNPCVLTAVNNFIPGQVVGISGVTGMTQLNGNTYLVVASTPGTITIDVNAIPFGVYIAGGTATIQVPSSSIVSKSINLTIAGNIYTEPSPPDGSLLKNGLPDPGSVINYATGTFSIAGGAAALVTGNFSYFPGQVSLGQRDFVNQVESIYPLMISFDETNSYQVNQTGTAFFYNVTYYKTTSIPFQWSATDDKQFWTTNYQGAFWATNSKPGFNFVNGTFVAGASPGTSFTINFTSGGGNFTTLIVGDKLWFNEWGALGTTINGITGTITDTSGSAAGNYVVTFTSPQTLTGIGIAQLLTNTIPGQDGIKWYDGDPTNKTGLPTNSGLGWVNFAPPLTNALVSINDTPSAKYYLMGALAILPFKDRLLFFNPTIGTSGGVRIQLQDTVIWSWNGTPYYTVSDNLNTADVVPINQTASYFDTKQQPAAPYFVDQAGLASFLSAGISEPILTVSNNEDVLLIGFGGGRGRKTRFVYSGNDLDPFRFFNINSELPSTSTFSVVPLDRGAIDIGAYGITLTDQQSCQRIDLPIPDEVFEISNLSNGFARVNAVRDFQKEWIYFSYPVNYSSWIYPTQTFLFNYRDNTWAILYENYTSRGTFRFESGLTWASLPYNNWSEWVDPWSSGIQSAQFPNIVGGTPQGYVQIIGEGVAESPSCTIYAIATANGGAATQITSFNHCVTEANPNTVDGDFIYITGMLGAISLNGLIGKVKKIIDKDNFIIDLPFPAGVYLGLGVFAKLSQPLLQTKQFNPYWEQGRQVRLSAQKYLLDGTANGQVTVNVYLSQDSSTVWNSGPFVPDPNAFNNAMVYSQLMYTCPESTNLGLTPMNTNLQMPTAFSQQQIWHRFNTSLIGDTVQIGITLSDAQMRNLGFATSEITLHGMHLTVDRSSHLA